MSTEFSSDTTDELAFVAFAGGPVAPCLEFGTMTNFEAVCTALDAGDTFSGLGFPAELNGVPSTVTSRSQLEALVVEGRVTFGRFPVVVALGSGEAFRFSFEA